MTPAAGTVVLLGPQEFRMNFTTMWQAGCGSVRVVGHRDRPRQGFTPEQFGARKGTHDVKTTHTAKQIIAGALLAGGVVAAGFTVGAGTGQTSTIYGTGGCPVGHYCGLLGR
jgi:hypothetical protein